MKLFTLLALAVVVAFPARGQSAFDGDARLQQKVTIRAVGLTMRDLLADLTARTGIKFAADPIVAEDKTALFAHDRPLNQTLESLAKFFRFTWVRPDGPPPFSYRLTQSLKQRKAEQEQLNSRVYRAADAIIEECREISKAAALPEDLLTARFEALRSKLSKELEPTEKSRISHEFLAVQTVLKVPQDVAAAKFLGRFNRDQIVDLLTAGPKQFASPAQSGWQPLPADVRDAIWTAYANNNRQFNRTPDFEPTFARIRAEGRLGLEISLTGLIESGRMNDSGGMRTNGSGFHFPVMRMSDPDDDDVDEPPSWREKPSFIRSITVKPKPFPTGPTEEKPLEPPFHARYFDELDQQLPVDLISDAFYSGNWYWVDFANRPLGDVLTGLARNSMHKWSIHDGFVHFRSKQYVSCRYSEPPFSRLKRWAEISADRLGTLDGMAEIASLPESQAQVALAVLTSIGKLNHLMPENNMWPYLRLWASLTPGQRALARKDTGLPVRLLRPHQIELAFRASKSAQGSRQRLASYGPASVAALDDESFLASALRFQTDDSISYGVRGPGGTSVSGGSQGKDAALQSLLRNQSGRTADDVQTIRAERVRFELISNRESILSSSFDLPQRWSPRKKQN